MGKKKNWQLFLIITVILLTAYNVCPTIFYYAKPLKTAIDRPEAQNIAKEIARRVDSLEDDAISWLSSFCNLLHVKPLYIRPSSLSSQVLAVGFEKREEANLFRSRLPRSGALIPFAPAKLSLAPQENLSKEVLVLRKIGVHLGEDPSFFSFFSKKEEKHRDFLIDRAAQIGFELAGPSDSSYLLELIQRGEGSLGVFELLSSEIHNLFQVFPEKSKLADRFKARWTQGNFTDRQKVIDGLLTAFAQTTDKLKQESNKTKEQTALIDQLLLARAKLSKEPSLFSKGKTPASLEEITKELQETLHFTIGDKNPFFSEIAIDLNEETVLLKWHPDIAFFLFENKENPPFERLLVKELAKISHLQETPIKTRDGVTFSLHQLENGTSYLALNLARVAEKELEGVQTFIQNVWAPRHPDLKQMAIVNAQDYQALPIEAQNFALVFYTPLADLTFSELENRSLYVIAKGVHRMLERLNSHPEEELSQLFIEDFQKLKEILYQFGYIGYFGASHPKISFAKGDFLFEKRDFAKPLLQATREEMFIMGTGKQATLELSNVEERILKENRIDTQIHQELLKWRDEYLAGSVNPHVEARFDIPKPTQSPFWSNFFLSWKKIWRGDERKILRWGLDLSGGKTVQIELRDQNGNVVKDPEDVKIGMKELEMRVNKLGVSEVSIRTLGHQIAIDFPSAQALSAEELIQSSSMYFHIVNEKFSEKNPLLRNAVRRFLEEVWNEALVSGKKDPDHVQQIAYQHLHASVRSEAAETLWNHHLRLARPREDLSSNVKDKTLSRVALFRGESPSDWQGQACPLLIVFHNFALEGSHLENIHSQYDPSRGNSLSFEVKSSFLNAKGERIDPRARLYEWSSEFSQGQAVTEDFSLDSGWRMAVLLNHTIISAPHLNDPLRDNGSISGHFSPREVQLLATDLKTGTFSFTPHILSEKNVSPELGLADRAQGIRATAAALLLVIFAMVLYYRFAGVIASIAVLFNLLILWGVLQNLGASLTLAGIAGIILTVGMAVDANVLVFERFKEEFAITKSLTRSIVSAYQKAFSAIVDSNVTTIIAALILLNFDAGPIKSFAINLIIGIASSMFTALFMTRYYFTEWASRGTKSLKMANWLEKTNFDFLKRAKFAYLFAILVTLGGALSIYSARGSIFGMDFTGGHALNIELLSSNGDEKVRVEAALQNMEGVSKGDFQVQELSPSNHLRLLFGTSLEEKGKPFYNLSSSAQEIHYGYEKNPRIAWIVKALEEQNLQLTENSKASLDSNWVSMSSQMSDSMRKNAALGLLLSFIAIFFYLTFRFESKFGAAALFCLLHDVCISLGSIGLLHVLGLPIQFDLSVVAALMTIVGYSLNDTIIIFDRIREELGKNTKRSLQETINFSLNATLSRTTITSGTTLLVLLALVTLGGGSIFNFSLVLTIGVFFGTLSSWFIASPFLLFLHRKESVEKKVSWNL